MRFSGPSAIPFDGQYYSKIHPIGNSGGGTVTVDWNNGNYQTLTLTGSPTIAFSNGQAGARYLLKIKTGAGGFTVTWPTVNWLRPGGAAPVIPVAASKIAVVGVSYDGIDYDGSYADNE